MKRKVLFGFLTLCLLLCLAPFGIKEASAASFVKIGTQSADLPAVDNTCTYYDGSSVHTDVSMTGLDLSSSIWSLTNVGGVYTLTLNGIDITTPYTEVNGNTYGIYYFDMTIPLTVNLKGTNTINGASWATAGHSFGFASNTGVTFTGTGTLNVMAGKATYNSYGLYVQDNITVTSGTLNITGNDATNTQSCGVYISYGRLLLSGGTLTATGNAAPKSYGVKVQHTTIDSGSIVANGGAATESYGIDVSNSFTINSGSVSATGGTATSISCGIHSPTNSGLNFNGGTTNASSGNAGAGIGVGIWGEYSCGCSINNDAVVYADASAGGQYLYAVNASGLYMDYNSHTNVCQLTATSGTASGAAATSCAINTTNKPAFYGGTLTAYSNDPTVGKACNSGFSYNTNYVYPGKGCCLLAGSDAGSATNQTANYLTSTTYTGNRYVKLYPYTTLATVTSLGTTQGPTTGGTTVVITGTNFDDATGVMFGTTPATSFTINSSTQITATSPASAAGTPSVTVTNPAGAGTTGATYTYLSIPTVSSVVATNGYYKAGDISFTVNFITAVTVTGTPELTINIGGTDVYANYLSGSGTSTLVFKYTISAGQVDTNGIVFKGLVANGGTIKSTAGALDATLTFTAITNTGVVIDTVAPVISTVGVSTTALTNGSVTVTVAAADSDSGLATLAYSFDGSNYQSSNWYNYSSNQTISANTIKVKDKAGNVTSYATPITISNIDTTAPTISSVDKSPTTATGGAVTVTVTANDINGIAATNGYSFDGGANWQTASTKTYTTNTTISAGAIQVKDSAGNIASYATEITISNIDTTAPTISSVDKSPTTATIGAVTITVTATDTNGIAATNGYSFYGGVNWQTANTKTYTTNTTIATGVIQVKDTIGNVASYATVITIDNIDTTAPTISSVDKSPTTATSGAVTVTVTATDTNGIAATNGYSFDGGVTWQTEGTKTYASNTTITANSIKVKDVAGNIASYATVITINNIDTTAPNISSVNKTPTTATSGVVTVTVTATDTNGIATTNGYSFDGGATWQTANTKTYTTNTTIAAGTVQVKDTVGNVDSYATAITINNIDTTAPTISSVEKSPTTATSGAVTATVTATDTNGIAATNGYSFDGGVTWQTANTKTYATNTTIAAGAIQVKDTVGNIAPYATAITINNIDTTAPTISSVDQSPTTVTSGSVTVTVTANDTNGIAAANGYSFDGGVTWQTANTKNYTTNTTITANSIKVKDAVGNVASYATAITINNIDTTAPTISAVNQATASGSATVTISATDANGVAVTNGYSFDAGVTWQTANTKTYTADTTIAVGSIKVKDTLGNIAIYNSAVTITIITSGSSGSTPIITPTITPGTIEKNQQHEEGAPQATINNSTDTLKASVFTTEEQAKVAAGVDAKITIKIEDISTTVSNADKKLVEEKLIAEQQSSNQQNSDQQNIAPTALYVDISLFKQVGSGTATKVTETSSKISISIEVPESLWNSDSNNSRTYRVVRVHNGAVEILDGTYDPQTHLFTFETDRFSTYALTYLDTKTTTGNTTDTTTDTTKDEITVYNDFYHLHLTAKATKITQTLSFAKVTGADGYLIYGAKCGEKMAKLGDVTGTVTSYTAKKLKQATDYKFQVKAYRLVDGKKIIIATSKVIYSITTSKTYANPSKVTSDVTAVTLKVGVTKTLTCQVILPRGMKLKQHTTAIRYESSNKAIATVSSTGKIIAKTKGTCYVYAYAQNGKYIKVKITVK